MNHTDWRYAVICRQQEIHRMILIEMIPIFRILRLSTIDQKQMHSREYIVTLRKDKNRKFIERTKEFHDCLKRLLLPNESLLCENKAFSIVGGNYRFTYVLEGYSKRSDQIGFIDNELPSKEHLDRLGVEFAFRNRKYTDGIPDGIRAKDCIKHYYEIKMEDPQLIDTYPNPAERLVKIISSSTYIDSM